MSSQIWPGLALYDGRVAVADHASLTAVIVVALDPLGGANLCLGEPSVRVNPQVNFVAIVGALRRAELRDEVEAPGLFAETSAGVRSWGSVLGRWERPALARTRRAQGGDIEGLRVSPRHDLLGGGGGGVRGSRASGGVREERKQIADARSPHARQCALDR